MKTAIAAALILFSLAGTAYAQCPSVVINELNQGGHVFITFCATNLPVKEGDAVTISSTKHQFGTTVVKIRTSGGAEVLEVVAAGPAAEDGASLESFEETPADVTFNGNTVSATVKNRKAAENVKRYKWALGPASKKDPGSTATATVAGATPFDATSASTTTDTSSAMRLQYSGEFAQRGFFRPDNEAVVQTHGTLSVDTTNSNDPGFLDNNSVTLGLRSLAKEKGWAGLKQVHYGIEGQLSKAAHQDLHDGNVVATFSAWVPGVPTMTIFSSVPAYIAPPLTIDLSYGYKNKEAADETFHGRGGDATATYRLYVYNKYEVFASAKWTLNDFSNRAATVPRTQRLYKVQISYLENPASGFKVAASYENGSVGPVLTKVRQFFVGLALSKFSFSGNSSSTQ